MSFTEKERLRLEALKKKEREAKAEERKEKKRVDDMCKKQFGMTADEVKEALENRSQVHNYWGEYSELKQLVDRLMDALPNRPESFEKYVHYYEQKRAEKLQQTE